MDEIKKAAAAAMGGGASNPEFFYLSQLIRDKVRTVSGEEIGTLDDLEMKLTGKFPEVVNLIVRRSYGRPPVEIPMRWVKTIDTKRTIVEVPAGASLKEFPQEPERILLRDMILDKKIIDTDEYEVEVVYDIHLVYADGRMIVVHVDVGRTAMLRRLRLGWLISLFFRKVEKTDLLPWQYVQQLPSDLDRFHGDVKLNISKEKIADIHPVDLADILEELSGAERLAVFNALDTETAADTLEETEPRVQRDLVSTVRRDRLIELLQTMSPAQVADILEVLPRLDAEALKKALSSEVASKVNELLSQHDVSLPSLATNRYLALPDTARVDDALFHFRDRSKRFDVVMYVYITSPEGILKGVVDIRELIQASPNEPLGSIMTEQVVTLGIEDTLPDASAEFAKYGFRALPLVDMERKLLGVISYKDLLAVKS